MTLVRYLNGAVTTMDDAKPEAEAFAVRDGLIEVVGSTGEVRAATIDSTAAEINLEGRRVIPGIVDSHLHLLAYALGKRAVDLSDCASIGEAVGRLEERAVQLEDGEWVRGINFDHSRFAEHRLPRREDLDHIGNPVFLTRVCRHAHVVNSAAMERAGIEAGRTLPEGIQLDDGGEPTGVILETGVELVESAMPSYRDRPEEAKDALLEAMAEYTSWGVTSLSTTAAEHLGIHEDIGLYQLLEREGRLPLRVTVHGNDFLPLGVRSPFGGGRVRWGGMKLFVDGGFCARTAAMSRPYTCDDDNWGALSRPPGELRGTILKAHRQGVQVAMHVIGDAALETVLGILEEAYRYDPRGPRHRILHCYIAWPEQRRRLAALPVSVDVQPIFAADEMDIADGTLEPALLEHAYAWRSLREAGVHLSGSSDNPAALPNPWLGIDAAVNRERIVARGPEGGWHPGEKLDIDETMELFTRNGAWALGQEEMLGAITPGKWADFAVLQDDPWKVDTRALKDIRVWRTYCGGRCVFARE
ncbi:MAG: amidohydrolase [Synergistales bacterium]|nr:amidohydrolase [Synergistales bacterium]